MAGYVVCQACGTRIKAGRGHCLKCFEPLPHPDDPVAVPLSVSLGLSKPNQMILGGVAVAIVAGLLYIIWTSDPGVAQNDAVASLAANAARTSGGASRSTASSDAVPMPPIPSTVVVRDPGAEEDAALVQQRDQLLAELVSTPDNAVTLNKLALLLAQTGQNEDAFKRFEQAIALEPRRPEFRMNLAGLAAVLGQWGRATDQYREAVLLTPKDYAAQYALAVALQRKGDDELAVTEFKKARRLKPDPLIALGMGASLERLGRKDEAVREYQDFIQARPNSSEAEKAKVQIARMSSGRS
jgi:tetratricopeptide (TPR) repeat protein